MIINERRGLLQELAGAIFDLNQKTLNSGIYYRLEIDDSSIVVMRFDKSSGSKLDYLDKNQFKSEVNFIYFWMKNCNEDIKSSIDYLRRLTNENK